MSRADAFFAVMAIMDEHAPTRRAAMALARGGVPVFPCEPQGKRPATKHGMLDATTEIEQIDAWWRRMPTANIGMPTGGPSGIVVVDVDVHGSADGYRASEAARRAGLLDGWQMQAVTPTGGMHIYFPSSGEDQRSWQAARVGVDFRGDGGYIIVPPSQRTVEGQRAVYAVSSLSPVPGSDLDSVRLREFLVPWPEPSRSPVESRALDDHDVARIAAWVTRLQEGERNHGLFWAACKLAEHGTAAQDAHDILTPAACQAGLSEREAGATIRSAYRAAAGVTGTTPAVSDATHVVPHALPARSLS